MTEVGDLFKVLVIILVRDVGGLNHRITLERVRSDKIMDILKTVPRKDLLNGWDRKEKEVR